MRIYSYAVSTVAKNDEDKVEQYYEYSMKRIPNLSNGIVIFLCRDN